MKKNKYRFKSILVVRKKAREDAAQHLALSRENLISEENELERRFKLIKLCQSQIKNSNEKMHREMVPGTNAGKIISHRIHLRDLKSKLIELEKNLADQKENVKTAEELVIKATEILISASKEVKIIEKHKEHWDENERKVEIKLEQKLSDEIGAILHQHSEKL